MNRVALFFGAGLTLGSAAAGWAASLSPPTTYTGMCDASAAVALTSDLFAVANDEDNVIRVYNRQRGGAPVKSFNLVAFLGPGNPGKPGAETDLEGAAPLGDRVYWITSHGRNAIGRPSPARQRFFATKFVINGGDVQMQPVGRPYARLLDDLIREPALAPYDLYSASQLAPKSYGALNIEGLCATPEGHLLIGFRNPIPRGKALLVPLLNAPDLIDGKPARFGAPILLDLGGYGIRSMGYTGDRYLIIAGPYHSGGRSRLYEWPGGSGQPRVRSDVKLKGLNPEGVAFVEEGGQTEYLIVSDDGTRQVNGVDCKRLKVPAQRRFRGYLLLP